MDECGVERVALDLARARLMKLAEYEGCRVRLCIGDTCWSGELEDVDAEAATVSLRGLVDNVIVVVTVDPNQYELQVYGCPDSTTTVPDGTEGVEDGTD